jgi:hypothetical protein
MAHSSDSDLKALKERALAAWVSGAHLAHAELHLMNLIDEVLALRGGKKNALKEKVSEHAGKAWDAPGMEAPKFLEPEAPKAPEKEPEDDKSMKSEDDADKASKSVKSSKKK